MWQELLQQIKLSDIKALARTISLVENEVAGYEELLLSLTESSKKIIGITGPPGAGKSTLVNALIGKITEANETVGVLCVDPSSPFHYGALLGDRIRMSDWYNHPGVFIRSVASHGSMGGLHPKIIEITDIMKAYGFDHIIVETVGVGQSEIEIAGLADTVVVVLVPEGGDEVQTMKAGLMEIANIFVVNKADRPEADTFVNTLKKMLLPSVANHQEEIPVLQTVATQNKGIDVLLEKIKEHQQTDHKQNEKISFLAEKAFYMIREERIKDLDKALLKERIRDESKNANFNLYKFISSYTA